MLIKAKFVSRYGSRDEAFSSKHSFFKKVIIYLRISYLISGAFFGLLLLWRRIDLMLETFHLHYDIAKDINCFSPAKLSFKTHYNAKHCI